MTKKKNLNKKTMVQVGDHLIDLNDVSSITKVRNGLYIIKFISNPNPTYACWVATKDITQLTKYFNVIESGVDVIKSKPKREVPDFYNFEDDDLYVRDDF